MRLSSQMRRLRSEALADRFEEAALYYAECNLGRAQLDLLLGRPLPDAPRTSGWSHWLRRLFTRVMPRLGR